LKSNLAEIILKIIVDIELTQGVMLNLVSLRKFKFDKEEFNNEN